MAKDPGALLQQALREKGWTKTELAEKVGVRYPTVLRWTRNQGFTASAQQKVAAALNLPLDHFSSTDAEAREKEKRKALDQLYADPDAADLTQEERLSLESVLIPPGKKPTYMFYLVMMNILRNRLEPWKEGQVIEENEAIAAQIRRKMGNSGASARPPKRKPRKSHK